MTKNDEEQIQITGTKNFNTTEQVKPYDGLARVTEICTKVCGEIEPGWLGMCTRKEDCKDLPEPTEEEILDWSSTFGTWAHELCLEAPEAFQLPTGIDGNLLMKALRFYQEWLKEYAPARIEVEKVVIHPDKIYGGTVDMFCRVNGKRYIVDLKFWGWWKEKWGYEQSKDIFPSCKAVKVNLQTTLYAETKKKPERHTRACLVIHPLGWKFHEFKRESSKLEEALKVAEELSKNTDAYLLKDF